MRNPYLCVLIVTALGLCGIVGMVGVILMGLYGKEPPGSVVAIVSGCIGSLSSFLVMPPRGSVGAGDAQKGPAA
jgi:hypothetical protein